MAGGDDNTALLGMFIMNENTPQNLVFYFWLWHNLDVQQTTWLMSSAIREDLLE